MNWNFFWHHWRRRVSPQLRRICKSVSRHRRSSNPFAWEHARRTMWLDGLEDRKLLSTVTPTPTLASTAIVIDFDNTSLESYSGPTQDIAGSATSQAGGNQLYQYGNNWKKIAQNYTVTANTILEFDFKSTQQGEIHGIGFDTDNVLSRDTFFQLYGTQDNWGLPTIEQYDAVAGSVKHYTIRVGDYFTGQFSYLTFGMDNDIPSPNSNSTFTNIQIYEDTTHAGDAGDSGGSDGSGDTSGDTSGGTSGGGGSGGEIDFNDFAINSLGSNQDVSKTYTVNADGTQLALSGNTWKQIAINYNITADTVLEFDFRSSIEGEVQGIGFDTDLSLSGDTFFKVFGSQNTTGWSINNFDTYNISQGSVRYSINVGNYFTGQFQYLVFGNDQDIANPTANSSFTNVKLYEPSTESDTDEGSGTSLPTVPDAAVSDVDAINFSTVTVQSYDAAQDLNGNATVLNDGQVLALTGNTWKQIALPTTVDANTYLEFDFYSDNLGEVHGIGFDTDSYLSSDQFFQLYGTQPFGIQNFNTYSQGSGWSHYKIKVSDYFVGNFAYLVLAMDHDVAAPTGTSYFANIQIYQTPAPAPGTPGASEGDTSGTSGVAVAAPAVPTDYQVIDFASLNVSSYGGVWQDVAGVQQILDGGRTYYLAGNSWKKFDFNYNVTASTVLEFDYRSAAEGEVQGIGFDTNDTLSNDQFFQVFGTQSWSQFIVNDYDYAQGTDGWVHYAIPVGTYFTGLMSYLTIGMDNDISIPISENYFANVGIYNTATDVTVGTAPEADDALQTLDFSSQAVTAYDPNQQGGGVGVVEFDGSALHLTGNTWQKISLPYNVNPYTILEFDYFGAVEGEVQGIGFDADNTFQATDSRFFQINGSQTYGIQNYATYSIGDGWTHYKIPVGDFVEGFSQYLIFANDQDAPGINADVYYANVSLYDQFTPDFVPDYNRTYGYGLVDAAAAVADALGVNELPDQEYYGGQNQYDLNMINVPEVWDQGITGNGVIVAIIDTGVNIAHSDLNDNIWVNTGEIAGDGIDNDGNGYIDDVNGYNFVDNNANVTDTNGHGTLVAGVVAAENNGTGSTGVAYDAQIMPVRVLDGYGGGDFFSVLDGIYYAVNNGADVINLSLTFNSGHPYLKNALKYAQDRGVVVVMASGNDSNPEPLFPAQYANQYGIAVGAVTAGGHLTNYTNLAGSVTKNFVMVPGIDIFTTSLGGGWATVSASSFATPLVTGVAALLKAANPSLSAVQIQQYIALNANPYEIFL